MHMWRSECVIGMSPQHRTDDPEALHKTPLSLLDDCQLSRFWIWTWKVVWNKAYDYRYNKDNKEPKLTLIDHILPHKRQRRFLIHLLKAKACTIVNESVQFVHCLLNWWSFRISKFRNFCDDVISTSEEFAHRRAQCKAADNVKWMHDHLNGWSWRTIHDRRLLPSKTSPGQAKHPQSPHRQPPPTRTNYQPARNTRGRRRGADPEFIQPFVWRQQRR